MWHIVHDRIMYIHELLLCNPCESLDQMQDIFHMVRLQLLRLDLNDREKIFVYYHVHSSFPFFRSKSYNILWFWRLSRRSSTGVPSLRFCPGFLDACRSKRKQDGRVFFSFDNMKPIFNFSVVSQNTFQG